MYKETKLKNGLKIITAPIMGTKTITILIMIGTGSRYENRKNNGISHFLEHMFFKGTKKRPSAIDIAGDLDSVGGEYNAFTSKEYTGYWVKVDYKKIVLAGEILNDMLNNSKFEPGEIEREKGVIIEEVNMYHDNPMMYIEDLFEKCLYGDTSAGWEIIGPKENILNFKQKDFLDYLNSQYIAENAVVCLAGNINKKSEEIIKNIFLNFKKNKKNKIKNKIKIKENQKKPITAISFKKTDQANLSLGVRSFSLKHKDKFILKVLGVILGGSMSSRLFTNLRERNGLAYYVRTRNEFYSDSGYLATQAGVPVDKTEKAIEIILKEYKNIANSLVEKKELERAKDLILGRLAIQLEASDDVASWYVKQRVMGEEILTPEDFVKEIKNVSAEDIKRVANNIFKNEKLNLAVIGPFKDNKKFLKILTL